MNPDEIGEEMAAEVHLALAFSGCISVVTTLLDSLDPAFDADALDDLAIAHVHLRRAARTLDVQLLT
jgi:hypothetical protein